LSCKIQVFNSQVKLQERYSYNPEMLQCLLAIFPAAPKSDNPTITIAGAIVSGVMNRKINPTIPLIKKKSNNLNS
jgi:hypothetical protein